MATSHVLGYVDRTMRRFAFFSLLSLAVACSSSSAPTVKADGGLHDAHGGSSTGSGTGSSSGSSSGSCGTSSTCTGSLSGGVEGTFTSCTVSAEQGAAVGFGEVTFEFAVGSGITGSGNVSTKGKFDVASYRTDAGLWNDTGMTGTAADSLWSVVSPGDGAMVTAECNGIASPDETPNVCQGAVLDVTRIDSCNYIHGTLTVDIPTFRGVSGVTIQLSF